MLLRGFGITWKTFESKAAIFRPKSVYFAESSYLKRVFFVQIRNFIVVYVTIATVFRSKECLDSV